MIIVYNMAAPATSQQATDLLEDESLAEEVQIYFDICWTFSSDTFLFAKLNLNLKFGLNLSQFLGKSWHVLNMTHLVHGMLWQF